MLAYPFKSSRLPNLFLGLSLTVVGVYVRIEDIERFATTVVTVRVSRMGIYSNDLRIRAVAAVDRGIPRRAIVETFSITLTTLKRWLRMRMDGKYLSPGFPRGVGDAFSRR